MNRSRALIVLTVLLAAAVAQLSGANPAGAITPTFTPDILASNHLYSLTNYVDGKAVAWADYNGDGNLDLLVTPSSSGGTGGYPSGTYLYKGDGAGGFTEDTTADANLADVSSGAVAWGDYNGDGKPDILLTGLSFATTGHPSTPVAKLYKQNSSGVYVEDTVADASLTGVSPSSVAWGDYNNDGRPDILLSGTNASSQPTLKLYENNGDGTFTEDTNAGLTWDTSTEVFPGLVNGSVAWGDYNNDGYLDILVTGGTGFSGDSIHPARVAKILKNNADGSFSEDKTADPSLTPVENSAAAWGDYDNDGDLDILLAGCDNSSGACASVVSKVYTNNGSGSAFNFTQYLPTATLQGSKDGGAAWGDYNSDGKPDILLSGDDAGTHPLAGKAYANTGSPGFTVDSTGFQIPSPGTTGPGTAAFGDYNNDGKLDAVLTGSFKTNIFQNNSSIADTAPTTPTNPTFSRGSTSATFSWTASTDTQQASTPNGLTYNLRVGTTPGGSDIVPSMSLSSGKRLVPAPGNVGEATSYTLTGLTPGVPYYWSVQAVDASFVASAFSTEQVFALGYSATTPFAGIEGGSVAFGDYNSDGTLDAVVTGTGSSSTAVAKVYKDTLTPFHCVTSGMPPVLHCSGPTWTWSEDTSANLTAVSDSSAAWGDYNNDGHLDLLIAGMHNSTPTTTLYTGDGTGAFTADASASFVGVLRGAVAFVDYNSDGRPDVLVTGWDNGGPGHTYAKLYRNNGGGSFSEDTTAEASLVGVNFSSIAVGDYNRDGRPDLLISGSTAPNSSSPVTTKLYKNNGDGTFTDLTTSAGLSAAAVEEGTVAWGDYNSDGWPDILTSGVGSGGSGSTKVFKNNGNGTFTQDASATALPWQQQSSAAWGDYNADGKPDILLAGLNNAAVPISAIFENQGSGAFTDIGAGLTGVTGSSVAWGDYNADGKLDALVAGCTVGTSSCTDSSDTTTLYTSSIIGNAAPAAPRGLTASFASGVENLSWSAPTDDHTPSAALSYNLRVGTSSGGTQIVSPLSLSAGTRLVPQDGNVGERTSYALSGLTPGTTYHWSVQAVDSGFAGSAFATEGTFTVPETFALSASAYSVGEGGGHATITVNRSGWTDGAASVHFATANGTATAGSDYTAVSQTLSFAKGDTSKTVSIPITDDSVVESSETVLLSLSSPSSGATLGNPHAATLTIADNDVAPPPPAKHSGKIKSAKLSKKSFSVSRAGKVKLTCKFSPKSKVFKWALSLKQGKKWTIVKRVSKSGSFKKITLSVKKLFAGKPIKRGSYRLKLSGDRNSRTLSFRIK